MKNKSMKNYNKFRCISNCISVKQLKNKDCIFMVKVEMRNVTIILCIAAQQIDA